MKSSLRKALLSVLAVVEVLRAITLRHFNASKPASAWRPIIDPMDQVTMEALWRQGRAARQATTVTGQTEHRCSAPQTSTDAPLVTNTHGDITELSTHRHYCIGTPSGRAPTVRWKTGA